MRSNKAMFSALLLGFAIPAHAYVDPGTGSLAVQFLIGGAVALAYTIKTYYYAIRAKIRSLLGRPDLQKSAEADLATKSNDEPAD